MTQRFVVNGVEYDSPESMPPEVRQQYEHALNAIRHIGEGGGGAGEGDVKVNVTTHVRYNINGKTYENPAAVPAEIRPMVDRAFVEISRPKRRGGTVLLWVLIAAVAVLILALLQQ
jgi:hypothetical protein